MTGTEVVPAEPAEPTPPPAEAPRKRRRGWIVALVVVAILLVLGVVGALVAEGFAKDYARDYVRARVVEVLGLEPDARVDVDLGGGSIILQALAGRVDDVAVDVPEVEFGALAGSVRLTAEDVPLDPEAPTSAVRIAFAVDEDDLPAIASSLSGLELSGIDLDPPVVAVTSEFAVLGIPVPLGMELLPSAADGELAFDPQTVTVAGAEFSVRELLADPLFGPFARDLLTQQSVCVAANLPAALELSGVVVEERRLVLVITGADVALGGPGLSTPGTCPSAR